MKHKIQTSYFGGSDEITLPDMPFPLERDPRHETAPRGNSRMISRPYTAKERLERDLWREGVI